MSLLVNVANTDLASTQSPATQPTFMLARIHLIGTLKHTIFGIFLLAFYPHSSA